MDKYQYISHTLCHVAEAILWEHAKDWALKKNPAVTFKTRIGTGKATYCRTHRGNHGHFVLTFGQGMVASKFETVKAPNWLTAQELRTRGYFNGRFYVPELLAHTVCHEFAHVIQVINDWRSKQSVHNDYFYQVLDRIHASGHADKVLLTLQQMWAEAELDMKFIDEGQATNLLTVEDFTRGEMVNYEYEGAQRLATVMRLNRKTVGIVFNADGFKYKARVSPALLRKR